MVSVPAASVARGPGSSPGLGTLCSVLAKTLYSHRCLSPPRCINAGGGEGIRCDGLASHPGGVDILLVAELRPNEPFTSRAEFASFM